jgi:glycosyltransferase involved in cell wall biosynthesis
MAMEMSMPRPSLVYALHSGNLYGTERMALATAAGLAGEFDCSIMAPKGAALEEAARLGFRAVPFSGARQFAAELWKLLGSSAPVAFFATGVMHSSICLALNLARQRTVAHLHLVHGGAEERLSYGQKKKLNSRPVKFVAVSGYVRERLIANGVADRQIRVIENFLPDMQVNTVPQRAPFSVAGVRKIIVISRLDPEKRVDLLLDALEHHPDLAKFDISVFGRGWNESALTERASAHCHRIEFKGFSPRVADELAASDLLVHLCPVEPFGLAILEAMAARVPVLVPDSGGAGSLVEADVSGFRFRSGDRDHLAECLRSIDQLPPSRMNRVVCESQRLLRSRFSESARIAEYRNLIQESFA